MMSFWFNGFFFMDLVVVRKKYTDTDGKDRKYNNAIDNTEGCSVYCTEDCTEDCTGDCPIDCSVDCTVDCSLLRNISSFLFFISAARL